MAIVASQVAAVQQLYVSYFGRPADPAGLDYWTNIVEAQKSTAAVSATFAASAEYKAAYEGKTNAQIVDQIYTNLFGRAADATGRAYWVDLLDKGTIKVDTIVYEVSIAALTTDKEAVENKVAAATAFTAALDTDAEKAGYAGADALALAKAFITSVTTDETLATQTATAALNATVAAVVSAGTEFTLQGAMANLLAAQESKSDVLADLAEDEAVAAELAKLPAGTTVTDTHIANAIKAVQTTAASGADRADLLGTGFSKLSPALQAAKIEVRKVELAEKLAADEKALGTANTEAGKVANLSAAIETYTQAQEATVAAKTAAALAGTASSGALANLGTLAGGTVDSTTTPGTVTLKIGTAAAKPVIVWDATDKQWELEAGVTEANTKGVTAALNAINAYAVAADAETKAITAEREALIAADILDVSDNGTMLANVAKAFAFTQLGTNEMPTYDMIVVEEGLFKAQLDTLNAAIAANAPALVNYKGFVADLKSDIAAALTDATTPADNAATAKAFVTAAGTAGYLTAANVTAINAAIDTPPTTGTLNDVIDANNWDGRSTVFTNAKNTLINAEAPLTGPDAEPGIGNLAKAVIDAQNTVDATEKLIDDLDKAVAAYDAASALGADVTAADDAIKAATKVITDEGFAAPAFLKALGTGLNLSTAKDDIFLVASNSADAEVRAFGIQGEDTLYVGTSLAYNDTEIGSGTGQTKLPAAGDDAVLEFFLEQRGSDVIVLIENKAFGSSSTGAADVTEIKLVGVDLEDITVANGFITV